MNSDLKLLPHFLSLLSSFLSISPTHSSKLLHKCSPTSSALIGAWRYQKGWLLVWYNSEGLPGPEDSQHRSASGVHSPPSRKKFPSSAFMVLSF